MNHHEMDLLLQKKMGCFCVVVLLAACAARTSDTNRGLASNLISELQDLLVEQKNFNREIEKVGASASDLARQKSVLSAPSSVFEYAEENLAVES